MFVTVKQYHLQAVLPFLNNCETCLVFLQNGMSHLDYIANLHAPTIYVGVVEHGAIRMNETTTNHKGKGMIKLGYFAVSDFLRVESLNTPIFPVEYIEDYKLVLQEKLVINSVINPLTAILKVKNGQLMTNLSFKRLSIKLVNEVCQALKVNREQNGTLYEKGRRGLFIYCIKHFFDVVDLEFGKKQK